MGHCLQKIVNKSSHDSERSWLEIEKVKLTNFDINENKSEYNLLKNGDLNRNVYKITGNNNIFNSFKIIKILGKGGSCRVLMVNKIENNIKYAMKELQLNDEWNPILFKKEIDILTTLKHENILEYKEGYITKEYLYINTKLYEGGELLKKIKKLKHYSEKNACDVIRVLLKTINHIHNHNICHRDLKPENIVYRNNNNNLSDIILIDFGDAELIGINGTNNIYTDFVGTPYYLAPECVRNRYGWELYKSDMWSIGVITYVMLFGKAPFWGKSNQEIINKITKHKVLFPSKPTISKHAKNFILCLLERNTLKRLSASQALIHPWLIDNDNGIIPDIHLGNDLINKIDNFHTASKLKKLIITQMIKNMTYEQKIMIANAFKSLDINDDGFIDERELTYYLIKTGYLSKYQAKQRAKQLISIMDKDNDGKIDLNEWVYEKTASKLRTSKSTVKLQFNKLKHNSINEDETTLTPNELRKSLGSILSDDDNNTNNAGNSNDKVNDIIDELELDENGHISYEMFSKAVKQQTIHVESIHDTNNIHS